MAVAVENRSSRRTQISERVLSVAIGTALHPLRYVKVLVQLGNDPYPIYRSKAYIFFGPYRYFLPNGIQYSRYIYQKDGFLGLYNGLGASISGYLVSSLVSSRVAQYLNEQYPDEPPKANESDAEAFGRHVKKVIKDTLSKCAGTVAARPFQVAMIRSMAQFIGGERMYLGLILSLKSIYDQTGIKGYFYGLVPQLIGEVLILWTTSSVLFLIKRCLEYFQNDEDDENLDEVHTGHEKLILPPEKITQLLHCAVSFYVNGFFYHFQLISTLMAVNDSGLAADRHPVVPNFECWEDYYDLLKSEDQLKRGAKLLRRPYNGAVYYFNGQAYPKTRVQELKIE